MGFVALLTIIDWNEGQDHTESELVSFPAKAKTQLGPDQQC